jgi:hypothetical protein
VNGWGLAEAAAEDGTRLYVKPAGDGVEVRHGFTSSSGYDEGFSPCCDRYHVMYMAEDGTRLYVKPAGDGVEVRGRCRRGIHYDTDEGFSPCLTMMRVTLIVCMVEEACTGWIPR